MLEKIRTTIDNVTDLLGHTLAWLTLAMMLITCAVVFLRYGLNTGSIALQETVTYLHASVLLLGSGYTLKHNGHVRVDILYQKFSTTTKAWIDLMGAVLFLIPVCGFIAYYSFDYVTQSWSIQEKSQESGGLPFIYLLKTLIPLMAIVLIAQGIAQAIKDFIIIRDHRSDDNTPDPEAVPPGASI